MPKYIIERKVSGVGRSSEDQIREMSQKSNEALKELGDQVQWLESFVTDDSTYCIYVSPNEELIRRHAQIAGFPADKITRVDRVIDPSTAEMEGMPQMTTKEKPSEKTMRQ